MERERLHYDTCTLPGEQSAGGTAAGKRPWQKRLLKDAAPSMSLVKRAETRGLAFGHHSSVACRLSTTTQLFSPWPCDRFVRADGLATNGFIGAPGQRGFPLVVSWTRERTPLWCQKDWCAIGTCSLGHPHLLTVLLLSWHHHGPCLGA